ncbi:hypothetical protein G436_3835 [Leptospira interrogans serovar Hardjo str. Norma]|uniref:Uncharacterized protein n=1 Tax=Leptospira interrogans serovar Hardjo str. Norma TaxID=1279460 RepID=A0A0M4NBE3_LEPIR|nr:hypothetical protein G436_3835 [Leptospira interrogans serovar Hardjo str. Norma]
MLKNSLVPINKTALIARFHKIETDGELIFQLLYSIAGLTKLFQSTVSIK